MWILWSSFAFSLKFLKQMASISLQEEPKTQNPSLKKSLDWNVGVTLIDRLIAMSKFFTFSLIFLGETENSVSGVCKFNSGVRSGNIGGASGGQMGACWNWCPRQMQTTRLLKGPGVYCLPMSFASLQDHFRWHRQFSDSHTVRCRQFRHSRQEICQSGTKKQL